LAIFWPNLSSIETLKCCCWKGTHFYHQLTADLGDVAMLGDGCEPTTLRSAGIERADLLIAATGDDADNLVVCQMAMHCFGPHPHYSPHQTTRTMNRCLRSLECASALAARRRS